MNVVPPYLGESMHLLWVYLTLCRNFMIEQDMVGDVIIISAEYILSNSSLTLFLID